MLQGRFVLLCAQNVWSGIYLWSRSFPDGLGGLGCQLVSKSLLVFKSSSNEFSTAMPILACSGFITVSFLALLVLFLNHSSCRILLPELLLQIFLLPKEIPRLPFTKLH